MKIIGLTGRRIRDDFRTSSTAPRRSSTRFTFAIPSFSELPPTLGESGSVYVPRTGGFGGQNVQGFCAVTYTVEARVLKSSKVIAQTSVPVRIEKQAPHYATMPAATQTPATPALPKLVRKALSTASPEDVQVRMFDRRTAALASCARSKERTLSVPVTLLLRQPPHRASRMTKAPVKCSIDARFHSSLRIGTEPLVNSPRLMPVVDETIKWSRERVDVVFPPFYATTANDRATVTYATTADVVITVPEGVDMRSVHQGIYERTYGLRMSVSIDAGPDVPQQTAHGSVELDMSNSEPCTLESTFDTDEWASILDVEVAAPPPAYATVMRDPVVTISV